MPYTTELRDESARRALTWIGDAVKRARHARGLSQHALARQCGVDQGTISRLERGLAPGMRIESLARILRVVFAIDMRTDGPIPPVSSKFD
jgi:transcriptional regulator with XRE-family HTH domain